MRCLVTGGSGFIGSHVVDMLLDHGHEVVVLDLKEPLRPVRRWVQADIVDFVEIWEQLEHSIFDVVFHLAAEADVNNVYENPAEAVDVNVDGMSHVLEFARLKKIPRVVYASTVWVYSDVLVQDPNENTPLEHPANLYTATKITGEVLCHSYHKQYGLDCTILRYGIPYGPRAREAGVIPIFVRKALAGERLTIQGSGEQFRKFIYVEDLALAHIFAMADRARNKIYNVVGNEKVTILDVAETVRELVDVPVEIEMLPARQNDFAGKEITSHRIKTELHWQPRVDFREGMRRYIEWYKSVH